MSFSKDEIIFSSSFLFLVISVDSLIVVGVGINKGGVL